MFNRNNEKSMASSNNETVIAQGVKVEGEFAAQGNVVIEGELTGSVETSQALQVGQEARIYADVVAKTAVIAGEIQGNIRVSEKLELRESSKVHGDIDADTLSVSPGAKINGRITMNGGATPEAAKRSKGQEE
jgi:cytoskeletal protein CcmA (bactofilin family)